MAGFQWTVSEQYPYGDDNSAHFAVGIHIAKIFAGGEFNFWWHQSNLGIPLFAAYQPLPSLFLGLLLVVFSNLVAPTIIFKSTILIPWMLMPSVWYKGLRWYGIGILPSVSIALCTILIQDPYNIGFGIRSSTIKGLYTQHYGLLFLPLFVGSMKRYLTDACSVRTPALFFALTVMSHLWVGLYAVIAVVALFLSNPDKIMQWFKRLPFFILLSTGLIGWWIFPLLLTNDYAGGLPWTREYHDGLPLNKLGRYLVTGRLFDFNRFPFFTMLTGVGVAVIVRRFKNRMSRHWAVLTLLTFVLFLGRTNFGALYNLLPLHEQVNVMRYLTGIHICSVIAAGYALTGAVQLSHKWGQRIAEVFTATTMLSIIFFGSYDINSTLRTLKNNASLEQLVSFLKATEDNRIMVHQSLGTGNHFHRDLLPVLTNKGQVQSYAHGYHCTLSTYYAEYFDFSPTACDLFNVGHVVAKKPLPETFPVHVYQQVWENDTYAVIQPKSDDESIFSLIQVKGKIHTSNLRDIRPVVRQLMVPIYANRVLPELILDDTVAKPSFQTESMSIEMNTTHTREILREISSITSPEKSGEISQVHRGLSSYSCIVNADISETWVLLKVNYFPFWTVMVDGNVQPIVHVAPNFMAVKVPHGKHSVVFQYRNPVAQKYAVFVALLISGTLVCLTTIEFVSTVTRRFGKRKS